MLMYASKPADTYLLVWFISLLFLNLLLTITIYGYYYYRKYWHPFQGKAGRPGESGVVGEPGPNTIQCPDFNNNGF